MRIGNIYGAAFLILAGVNGIIGSAFGYAHTWFIWTIGVGLILLVIPGANETPRKRSGRQMGGAWTLLAGVIGGISQVVGWGNSWPLWLIGTGVILLVIRGTWRKASEETR